MQIIDSCIICPPYGPYCLILATIAPLVEVLNTAHGKAGTLIQMRSTSINPIESRSIIYKSIRTDKTIYHCDLYITKFFGCNKLFQLYCRRSSWRQCIQ